MKIHFVGGAIFGAKGNHYTKDGHCYLMEWNDETCENDILWCYLNDEVFIDAMQQADYVAEVKRLKQMWG